MCFEVIEYVDNFFKECNRLIKSLGYVFIRTPDCDLPMKVIYKGKEHPNPFTVKRLKVLAESYFKVVEVSFKAGLYPSLKYILLPRLNLTLAQICFEEEKDFKSISIDSLRF